MRVLVVDNEADISDAIVAVVRRAGHHCASVTSGEQALALLEHETFDLVVSDLVMPEMGGAELYDALVARGDPAAERMSFISAYVMNYENQIFLRRARRPFLAKPFRIGELRMFIEEQLGR